MSFFLAAAFSAGSACSGQEKATPVPKTDRPREAAKPPGALWPEAPGYDLFAGSIEDIDARVFQSRDFQKLLVLPGSGETAYVMSLKDRQVTPVPRVNVTATIDGALLAAGTAWGSAGSFEKKGADLLFGAGAVAYRLSPEPPLLGEVKLGDLLAKKRDYAAAARMYRPKNAALSLIKTVRKPIEITVFFGTWCSYCKKYLPRFMKTIEAAGNPNITVKYTGVDEDMTQPEAAISQFAISKTPTFVVRSGGRELGRIVEEPKESVEEDLALMLVGAR
jgi:thiol-disulfide isomerase/thioredoxin